MVVVIIGSSIACKSALETLLPELSGGDRVIIVTKDLHLFYSRVMLPNYIAGELGLEEMYFAPKDLLEDTRVNVINGEVKSLDTLSREIILDDGRGIGYDRLLITSGASPARMNMPGEDLNGVFCLRDLEDAQAIRNRVKKSGKCVVLGGGLVSLKAAMAVKSLIEDVSILVSSSKVLSKMADKTSARWIYDILVSNGIDVRFNVSIAAFEGGGCEVHNIVLQDGSSIRTDMVIIGKGVRPNMGLVENTPVRTDRGILVNPRMQTSVENVYAAGDVVQVYGCGDEGSGLFTLWPDAALQGRIAAANMLGADKRYPGGMGMNSAVFYGIPFIILGDVRERGTKDCEVYERFDRDRKVFRKVVVKNGRLTGAVFAGDINYAGMVYWDMRSGRKVESPEKYLTSKGLNELFSGREKF